MDQRTWTNLEKLFPAAERYERETISDLFDIADLIDDSQRRVREIAEDSGMPSLHVYLLEHLALNGGAAPLGDILQALHVPKQSATYIVDRLERDELVVRRPDPRDRRRLEVALTRKGRRRIKALIGPFYDTLLGAMQAVPARDRAVLRRALERFRAALGSAMKASDAA